ncbi:MAG: hypothetical protein ACRD3Y_11105 [Bryobacteraceae bacterium]
MQRWYGRGAKPALLEAIRQSEIQRSDNLEALKALESAFNHATRSLPPRPSSGLVEMQRWLAKLRR